MDSVRKRNVEVLALLGIAALLAYQGTTLASAGQVVREGIQSVTSMYTGADGLTHFRQVEIPYNKPIQLKGGVVFGRHQLEGPSAPSHFGNAPRRRLVVTLAGSARIVASSGEVFIADENHILLAEDLTGKGHSTRAVGPGDWVRMFLEIDAAPGAGRE